MARKTSSLTAIIIAVAFVVGIAACGGGGSTNPSPTAKGYIVLSWNNLGMHCLNPTFQTLAILPPYNTLWAQVIRKGEAPEVVTSGITVEYSFAENTYSAASTPQKTDFWTYVKQLFGADLAPDMGLAGKTLSGQMDLVGDHFEAVGIPLTEFRDADATAGGDYKTWTRYPYQLATVIVKSAVTGEELTRATVVAPVSSEINCSNCHGDTGDATTSYPITPSGTENVDLNILRIHDFLSATTLEASQPVLCASCHASNALGTAGVPGVNSLSNAVHGHHKDLADITPDTDGCYNCHPGPVTKCLRDVMTTKGEVAGCVTCHGTMATVAVNANPWLNEPRCDSATCHGARYAQDKALYRESKGHHGIYCAACHDSPHAIAPSREANDALKFTAFQGHNGPIDTCSLCHTSESGGIVHEEDD